MIIWYGNNEGMYLGWWDFTLAEEILKDLPQHEGMVDVEGAVVVLPARSLAGKEEQVNQDLQKLKWVVLLVLGDEENAFDVDKIVHNNMKVWIQTPRTTTEYSKFPLGPAPIKKGELPNKDLDYFFAGQITHSRRQEMAQELQKMTGGTFIPTKGFTQGLPLEEYHKEMSRAKVVPCPSGPETVETFRFYEALELGCIPIADTQTPQANWTGYWDWLFEDKILFSQISNWSSLPSYVDELKSKYPQLNNRIQSWWMRYKKSLKKRIYEDIQAVGGKTPSKDITIVVPVSPIPSHPKTHILDETLESIRHHFPTEDIIVTFDGVRSEQDDRRSDYEEHIRRILWKHDIIPYIFENHKHQIGMMREVIDQIQTPLLMYVESDCPIVTDEPIEWDKIKEIRY
jgi:hypothetical protein